MRASMEFAAADRKREREHRRKIAALQVQVSHYIETYIHISMYSFERHIYYIMEKQQSYICMYNNTSQAKRAFDPLWPKAERTNEPNPRRSEPNQTTSETSLSRRSSCVCLREREFTLLRCCCRCQSRTVPERALHEWTTHAKHSHSHTCTTAGCRKKGAWVQLTNQQQAKYIRQSRSHVKEKLVIHNACECVFEGII